MDAANAREIAASNDEDLAGLSEREQEILLMRHGFRGEPMTLEQIGREYGVTRERIRQIEVKAIKALRRLVAPEDLPDEEVLHDE